MDNFKGLVYKIEVQKMIKNLLTGYIGAKNHADNERVSGNTL